MGLREAYTLALRLERERPRMAQSGYRVYWMTASRFACKDLVAEPSSFLVAGRHTNCSVVLEDDPTIALRHLLVRSGCLDDGCPTLNVFDLETHQGFELSDGTSQRAISATGPIALRVGAYAIVALPSGMRLPEELPDPACERPRPVLPAAPISPYRGPANRAVEPSAPLSRITLLPAAFALSQRASFRPAVQAAWARASSTGPLPPSESVGTSGGSGFEVVLSAGTGGAAGVCFSKEDLEHGVLLGRSPKCVDAGLRPILNMGISRVHLLLLRERGECFAYDLASTQGTYQGGRLSRYTRLLDEGTELCLGTVAGIDLRWRAVV
jgi:hypothetical protein